MKSKNNFSNELAKNLKKKAVRKYALIILVAIIAISVVLGLNIEDKDSKLPDGQGNVITNEVILDEDTNVDKDVNEDVSSNKETANAVEDNDEETTEDSNIEEPVTNNSTSEDKLTTTSKPSTSENSTTNKPAVGNDTTVNKPSADKNTTTNKPSTDKNTTANKPSTDKNTTASKPSTDKETTSKPSTENKPSAEDLAVDNSKDPTASNGGNSAYKPDDAENVTVTIRISCNTLSNDMSKLENDSIKEYIPADGIILETVIYKGTTDNTVFDVLNTVCRNNGIHLESSYTPMYESYYVEGINYLYEFDGGPGSGWMYKVNGWYPNYGCSSYYLSDGDVIEWVYTCDYGIDVGGTVY